MRGQPGSRLRLVSPFAGVAAGQHFAQVIHVELGVMAQRVQGLMAQHVCDVIQVGPGPYHFRGTTAPEGVGVTVTVALMPLRQNARAAITGDAKVVKNPPVA